MDEEDCQRTQFRAKNLMDFLLLFIKIQSHLAAKSMVIRCFALFIPGTGL